MDNPITEPVQATPSWLTMVLEERGCLNRGRVIEVHKSSRSTITSIISRLELTYSSDASGSAPSQLFMKTSRLDAPLGSGKKEVEFYRHIAPLMVDPPSVRCYSAVYSPETGQSQILLDDLSGTHFQAGSSQLTSVLHYEPVIDCLARFHAFWWEHPRLGKDVSEIPTEESLRDYVSNIQKLLPSFFQSVTDRLSGSMCKLFYKAASSLPALWRHLSERRSFTLIHGDAHLQNFLYPVEPEKHKVYIIDWDFWNVSLGANDLAFMIALHWSPDKRRSLERSLIAKYHDELLKHGVRSYEWDDCWQDYRISVIHNLFTPVWQWSAHLSENIWWHNMERVMSAFQDLECTELLER